MKQHEDDRQCEGHDQFQFLLRAFEVFKMNWL